MEITHTAPDSRSLDASTSVGGSKCVACSDLVRKRRSNVERRFHELAVKHALGTATPEEEAKLDRYQQLRRERNGTAYETATQARIRYNDHQLLKRLKRLTRSAASNTEVRHARPECSDGPER